MENPLKYFSELRDPRVERTREHLRGEILLLTIAAVLSGASSWNEIEGYAHAKREWLQSFLTLPGGIPSHDTFNRVFARLDPAELEKSFLSWVRSIAQLTAGEVVAIDGKSLRGSGAGGKKAIVHMVSAWANTNNLVLGQQRVDEKSNEITAIPKLLSALELNGTIVTIDAMGCQKGIAQQIIDKQADYILAVKENQLHLLEDVRDSFQMLPSDSTAEQLDCGHGRVETRTCSALGDLSLVEQADDWPRLHSLVRIQAERYHKATGKTEREIRYYISSLRPEAARLNSAVRQHWGIENKLHWVLDVAFGEDASRKRAGNAAQNFSRINAHAPRVSKRVRFDAGANANKTGRSDVSNLRLKFLSFRTHRARFHHSAGHRAWSCAARNLQPIHVELEFGPWFGAEEHMLSIEGRVSASWGRLSRAEAKRSRRGRKRARRAFGFSAARSCTSALDSVRPLKPHLRPSKAWLEKSEELPLSVSDSRLSGRDIGSDHVQVLPRGFERLLGIMVRNKPGVIIKGHIALPAETIKDG
jgi:predicted transposase YbfD/YdcC